MLCDSIHESLMKKEHRVEKMEHCQGEMKERVVWPQQGDKGSLHAI
jgi:hypothetical protein